MLFMGRNIQTDSDLEDLSIETKIPFQTLQYQLFQNIFAGKKCADESCQYLLQMVRGEYPCRNCIHYAEPLKDYFTSKEGDKK